MKTPTARVWFFPPTRLCSIRLTSPGRTCSSSTCGLHAGRRLRASPEIGGLVDSVKFEPLTEIGKQMTRLSIAQSRGPALRRSSVGQGLAVTFDAAPETASAESRGSRRDLVRAPPSPAAAQPAPVVAAKRPPAGSPRRRGASLPMRSRRFVSRRRDREGRVSLLVETEGSSARLRAGQSAPHRSRPAGGSEPGQAEGGPSRVASSLAFAFRSFRPHRNS